MENLGQYTRISRSAFHVLTSSKTYIRHKRQCRPTCECIFLRQVLSLTISRHVSCLHANMYSSSYTRMYMYLRAICMYTTFSLFDTVDFCYFFHLSACKYFGCSAEFKENFRTHFATMCLYPRPCYATRFVHHLHIRSHCDFFFIRASSPQIRSCLFHALSSIFYIIRLTVVVYSFGLVFSHSSSIKLSHTNPAHIYIQARFSLHFSQNSHSIISEKACAFISFPNFTELSHTDAVFRLYISLVFPFLL